MIAAAQSPTQGAVEGALVEGLTPRDFCPGTVTPRVTGTILYRINDNFYILNLKFF